MFDRGKVIVLILTTTVIAYVVIGGFLGKVSAKDGNYRNLTVFNEVLRKIQDEYVEKPDIQRLSLGALRGLAYGVDFYSCYLPQDELQLVQTRQKARGWAGIVLSPRIGYYRVMQVMPGSNAEKAGILQGDVIEEVNGQGISEKSYPVADAMLRGEPGSQIKLGVIRGQEEDLTEFQFKLEEPRALPAEARVLETGIGLLRIHQLHENSAAEVRTALTTLSSSGANSLVLDLRDCAAGTYDAAIDVARLFLDKGPITFRLGKGGARTPIDAIPDKVTYRGRIAILINGYTSGPAEVLAAALKGHDRAQIVGLKTYGTASEQKVVDLEDGTALYLTTTRYLNPKGESIMNEKYNLAGIRPDVKSPSDDYALSVYIDYEMATGKDAMRYYKQYNDAVNQKQLDAAIELLKTPPAQKQAA